MKPNTRGFFDFCAWWTVLTSAVIATLLCTQFAHLDGLSFVGVAMSLFLGIVGMVGAITSLFMFVRMSAHVLGEQQYSGGTKAVWLLLFFLALPLGAVLYYFLVFRRVGQPIAG